MKRGSTFLEPLKELIGLIRVEELKESTIFPDESRRRTKSKEMFQRLISFTTKSTVGVLNNSPFAKQQISRHRISANQPNKEPISRVAFEFPHPTKISDVVILKPKHIHFKT